MALSLSHKQVLFLRMRSQNLCSQNLCSQNLRSQNLAAERRTAAPAEIVKAVCGLQAQVLAAAELGVGVRGPGLTLAQVETARLQERSIIWSWGVRGMLHLMATEDLDWLLPLVGPAFLAGDRRRSEQLGLDDATAGRGVALLADLLVSQGPQTRQQIAAALAPYGIPMQGQASIYLIARAAALGLVCHGPERQGEPSYVLLQDWCGEAVAKGARVPAQEALLDELARRYLAAYGPAGAADLATWSGIEPARNAGRADADCGRAE